MVPGWVNDAILIDAQKMEICSIMSAWVWPLHHHLFKSSYFHLFGRHDEISELSYFISILLIVFKGHDVLL